MDAVEAVSVAEVVVAALAVEAVVADSEVEEAVALEVVVVVPAVPLEAEAPVSLPVVVMEARFCESL